MQHYIMPWEDVPEELGLYVCYHRSCTLLLLIMSSEFTTAVLFQGMEFGNMNSDLENNWHHAIAYHFWLLAHQALYAGSFVLAFRASWWLRDYEDVFSMVEIYSLLALTSFYSKKYAQCSQAFTMLESCQEIPERKRKEFEDLAFSIFTRHGIFNSEASDSGNCTKCKSPLHELERKCSAEGCDAVYPVCVATAEVVVDGEVMQCSICRHYILAVEAECREHCPLCHSRLPNNV
eukprot:Gb_29649 [translate_table: standard]